MASYFQWTQDLSVGESTIDEHHQGLLSRVNGMIDAVINGITTKELNDMFDAFHAYADMHFAYEENYMRSIGYPEIEQHIEDHRNFEETLDKLRKKLGFQKESSLIVMELERFVGDWWIEHIGHDDQGYHKFAVSK